MSYQQLCRDFKFNREKLREINPLFSAYPDDANECEQYFGKKETTWFMKLMA